MDSNIIKIGLIGDICGGDLNYKIGWGIHSRYFKNTAKKQLKFDGLFPQTDFVLGNLETPATDKEINNQSFLASKKFTDFLYQQGINIVSIANNHILDHGQDGYIGTKKCLESSGISYVGDHTIYGSNYEIIEKNDVRIGICGFSEINTHLNRSNFAELLFENVENTIKKIKEHKVDHIIASLHWGLEYMNMPSLRQINLAKKIIDLGVSVIHGHHPHIIMPYQKYNKGVIFYSMGNFLMDMDWCKKCSRGLLATLKFTKSSVDIQEIKITSLKKNSLKGENIDGNKLELNLSEVISNEQYDIKQAKIHKKTKYLSYLFLLRNAFKLKKPTLKLLLDGFKNKIRQKST